jgi:manganese-dependent inorganic pyrophosphatase
MMLLAAVLSDTVVLSSPTTTGRDERVVRYLEESLELEARAFGMEMFQATSDVSNLPASDIINRDAKEYATSSGGTLCIAQVEMVGGDLLDRKDELLAALEDRRSERDYGHYLLMLTDIVDQGHRAPRGGQHDPDRARLRPARRGPPPGPAGRHEPQEAGGPEGARRALMARWH